MPIQPNIARLKKMLNRDAGLGGECTIHGHKVKIVDVTAAKTLTTADSGKIFLIDPAADMTITMPTIASGLKGWHCRIIVDESEAGTDGGMDYIVNVDLGSGTNLANVGFVFAADGDAGDICLANDDFIVFTAGASPGDYIDVFTDGNRWYVYGFCYDKDDLSFATAAS